MACTNPTGTTKGILIGSDPNDTGDRPLAAGTPFWVSPNVRLALLVDVAGLQQDPAKWDAAPWNGQVAVGSTYRLLVRLRNTDHELERTRLNLQGWVSDYTAGGVGPGSAIHVDPSKPVGSQGPAIAFTATVAGPLKAGTANLNDPANMLVLASDEQWTPNAQQMALNGGHVCVAVNVYGSIFGEVPSPDGGPLTDPFLDPTCNRMFGQRNIFIVAVVQGNNIMGNLTMFVPPTDRCPLRGIIVKRLVKLPAGPDGVLQNVPELDQVAREHGIQTLRRPDGYPLQHIKIGDGNGNGHHDDDHDHQHGDHDHHDGDHDHHNGDDNGGGFRVNVDPGKRANLTLTVDADHQRPGDAYAVDLVTTDTGANRLFGASRVYVLVTN